MDRRNFCKHARKKKRQLEDRLLHAIDIQLRNSLTRKIEMLNIMIQEFDPVINDQRKTKTHKNFNPIRH